MKKFILLIGLCVAFGAFAGREGNGGDGVVIDGKVYLFDLYENYNHLYPVLEDIEADPEILNGLKSHMINLKRQLNQSQSEGLVDYGFDEVLTEFAKKITAIKEKDNFFGHSLFQTAKSFSWSIVPFELIDVKDDDGTDINNAPDLVQVAVRYSKSIKLDNGLISKMDLSNLVATLMHEIIYSLIVPVPYDKSTYTPVRVTNPDGTIEEYQKEEKKTYWKQESRKVREIVNFLFSRDISRTPKESLEFMNQGNLPWGGESMAFGVNELKNFGLYGFSVGEYKFDINDKVDMNSKIEQFCIEMGNQHNGSAVKSAVVFKIMRLWFHSYDKEDGLKGHYLYQSSPTFPHHEPLHLDFQGKDTQGECRSNTSKAIKKILGED
ncbi:MAG: hypothetical protein KC478_15080 [Bacteriovoracaceae bacterium]|nr:hypothetical protein [Bacteriovoracaceae bacterium]